MKGRGGKIILRIVPKKKKKYSSSKSYDFSFSDSLKNYYSYFSFILIFDSLFRNDIRLNNINLQ